MAHEQTGDALHFLPDGFSLAAEVALNRQDVRIQPLLAFGYVGDGVPQSSNVALLRFHEIRGDRILLGRVVQLSLQACKLLRPIRPGHRHGLGSRTRTGILPRVHPRQRAVRDEDENHKNEQGLSERRPSEHRGRQNARMREDRRTGRRGSNNTTPERRSLLTADTERSAAEAVMHRQVDQIFAGGHSRAPHADRFPEDSPDETPAFRADLHGINVLFAIREHQRRTLLRAVQSAHARMVHEDA